jgi:hypothetical protein
MTKEEIKIYNKNYRENNKERIKKLKAEWYLKNINKNKEKRKIIYQENKEVIISKTKEYSKLNKDSIKKRKNVYYVKNKTKIINQHNEYLKNRKKIDPIFKLKVNIRTNIYYNLKKAKYDKNLKTDIILGCSYEFFKEYLESKFESWMTWENYGLYNGELNYGWDIDHIIPTSSATTEEELLKLNNFNNLQPLCSKINRDIKKDNF